MSIVAALRSRVQRRWRSRSGAAVKHEAELRWWLEHWDPVLRAGGFNPGDAPAFLDGEAVAPTYQGRRWQQARAEVRRVLHEAAIEEQDFFDGKVVLDIGPGPLGFPDACPARVSIGIEPLAERYRQSGLLLADSPALYLSLGAEAIPLTSASVDVILARNSLDHVDDPPVVLAEAQRLLRPGGTLILAFDVEHAPTATEPHRLSLEGVCAALEEQMTIERRVVSDRVHGQSGRTAILIARRR